MNKRGEGGEGFGDILLQYIGYIVFVILFFAIMFYFVSAQKNGAASWEDFYAKELVRIIDSSDAGETFDINVNKATRIAGKQGILASEIFDFDNERNEVSVRLSPGRKTVFSYFNEVDVVAWRVRLAEDGKNNILHFEIAKADEVVEGDAK